MKSSITICDKYQSWWYPALRHAKSDYSPDEILHLAYFQALPISNLHFPLKTAWEGSISTSFSIILLLSACLTRISQFKKKKRITPPIYLIQSAYECWQKSCIYLCLICQLRLIPWPLDSPQKIAHFIRNHGAGSRVVFLIFVWPTSKCSRWPLQVTCSAS